LNNLKQALKKFYRLFIPAKQEIKPVFQENHVNVQLNGDNIKIGKNSSLYNCTLGNFTYLAQNVSAMNTTIGKFCSIAQGACICLGMHPSSTFVSTSPSFFSLSKQNGKTFADKSYFEEMGKTTIGNDVWIGINAIIMDNVNIGNGAIIAAGAVVTTDIPHYAIAAGVPAKIIKYRFEQKEIAFLEDFKWWDKDQDWLQANFKDLHNIKTFIKKYAGNNS
jgi:acetyltransferase-like isoleucine patch superfamily enzyme